jgi:uncharacterized protein
MPVRSSDSSVFKWPDREEVDRQVRSWAKEIARSRPDVLKIGYIGSYARGDWGVGSDVDLVVILGRSAASFTERARGFDAIRLPVPADVLVYTEEEWRELVRRGAGLHRTATEEGVWVYP